VRRALLLYDALDGWATPNAFDKIVSAFRSIGVTEFVVFWPLDSQRALFERAALESIPALRVRVQAATSSETTLRKHAPQGAVGDTRVRVETDTGTGTRT
jgi:hypothetical protein